MCDATHPSRDSGITESGDAGRFGGRVGGGASSVLNSIIGLENARTIDGVNIAALGDNALADDPVRAGDGANTRAVVDNAAAGFASRVLG